MKKIYWWGPVVIWMAVIFVLSGRPSVKVVDIYTLNFLFFKTLHLLGYAFLYILSFRAFKNTFISRTFYWWALAAFILTIIYAVVDEVHQLFVPTREGKLRDVIIDSIGASLAWYLIARLLPKAPRKLREWARNWGIG